MSLSDDNQKLVHDLQTVIDEAESLLKSADLPSSADFQSAKDRFERTIKNARDEIVRVEQLLVHKAKEAAQGTDDFVQGNPWQAVGLGAAIGLVVGLLISRK